MRNFYVSPVAPRGHIYFTDREGTALVIKESSRVPCLDLRRLLLPIHAPKVDIQANPKETGDEKPELRYFQGDAEGLEDLPAADAAAPHI